MTKRVWRVVCGVGLAVLAARNAVGQAEEKAFPPHRVIGNVYYVGSEYTASYLVATPKGHILINSGFAETVPLIRSSVEKLGFKFTDIKVLLDSHAHNDHVAGHALVRRATGASVRVMAGDEGIIRTGGKGDFQYDSSWEPCPVDQVLRDGDEVRLGGAVLTARKTPGHTRGCTTWEFPVQDASEYEVGQQRGDQCGATDEPEHAQRRQIREHRHAQAERQHQRRQDDGGPYQHARVADGEIGARLLAFLQAQTVEEMDERVDGQPEHDKQRHYR